jgi:uncharacterized membrane protein
VAAATPAAVTLAPGSPPSRIARPAGLSFGRRPNEQGGAVIATSAFYIIFRFFHIVSGVLWVGSAFLFVGFIGPAAAEVGPAAGRLMSVVVKKRKAAKVITRLAYVTVLAGWILWLKDMSVYGLGTWLKMRMGIVFTIGGVLATAAAVVGSIGVGAGVERMVDLGDEIAASGGPPTPEQQSEVEHLGKELEKHGKRDLVLLLLAVIAMATARYW